MYVYLQLIQKKKKEKTNGVGFRIGLGLTLGPSIKLGPDLTYMWVSEFKPGSELNPIKVTRLQPKFA